MNKQHVIIGLFIAVIVILGVSLSGFVTSSSLAQGVETPRPKQQTKTAAAASKAEQEPTRDLTAKPRKHKTPKAPKETATPEPTVDTVKQAEAAASDALTSQLLILNPDRKTAKVTLDIYDQSGASVFNDKLKVKKNGAQIVNIPNSLGSNFLGSVRVSSNRRIQALVLERGGGASETDAYEVTSASANTLIFPYLRHDAATAASEDSADAASALKTQNVLIGIQNISGVTANATFEAFDTAGSLVHSEPLSIPAHASVYLSSSEMFTNAFIGSARITSDQAIAAAEVATYKADTASLRALSASDEDNRLVITNVEHKRNKGNTFVAWNEMYVRNSGDSPADFTVNFRTRSGALKGSVSRTNVPAGGLVLLDGRNDEFQFLGKNFRGWASIDANEATSFMAQALTARGSGKQLIGMGGEARLGIHARNVCGDIRTTADQKSTLVLTNAKAQDRAKVTIKFYRQSDGKLVSTIDRTIRPQAQLKITTSNGLPANLQGIAIVTTDQSQSRDVIASVLTATSKGKKSGSTAGYVCH